MGEPLEGEIFNVLTIREGLIVRMDKFKTRDAAVDAMRARREFGAQTDDVLASREPLAAVSDLVPFLHVADVQRSIAFYELLGFAVGDTYRVDARLDWALLRSCGAQLMLARADEPVNAGQQGVLFYLYSDGLAMLQQHLRAHDVQVGGICDGSPGPKQEMRLRDPDGYVLMVAQLDKPGQDD